MIKICITIDNRPIRLEVNDSDNSAEVYLVALEATDNDFILTDQIVRAVQAKNFQTIEV